MLVPHTETFSVEDSIQRLYEATSICLESLARQDRSAAVTCASAVPTVLGWLVILAVNEAWVEDKTRGRAPDQHFQDFWHAASIALPVTTATGPEVIEARLSRRPATFTVNPDNATVSSLHGMPLGVLERGLLPKDAARDVKQQLWKSIFKTDPPVPFPDDDNLRETLAFRYKRRKRESYYMYLPVPSPGQEPYISSLLSVLRQALPYLGIFQIGLDTGEQVLVIKEMTLMVLIREFLSMLGSYR